MPEHGDSGLRIEAGEHAGISEDANRPGRQVGRFQRCRDRRQTPADARTDHPLGLIPVGRHDEHDPGCGPVQQGADRPCRPVGLVGVSAKDLRCGTADDEWVSPDTAQTDSISHGGSGVVVEPRTSRPGDRSSTARTSASCRSPSNRYRTSTSARQDPPGPGRIDVSSSAHRSRGSRNSWPKTVA